jgi:hypothetical protein
MTSPLFLLHLIASQIDSQNTIADDKFVVFEKWLLDNGSKFPKLELKVTHWLIAFSFAVSRTMEMK